MPHKGKLPAKEKIRLVEAYIAGEIGASAVQQAYMVNKETFYSWVRLYKARGAAGLYSAGKNRKYAPELKRQAVEEYLAGTASLSDLCTKYDISDKYVLRQWIKRYNGCEDFKQPNSGGAIYMTKGRKTTLEERIEIVSYCIANNNDYGKVIELYGVSYQQIYTWVKKYEKDGPEGLADRRGKPKDQSFMSEVEKLRVQLKLKEAENLRLQMENDLLKKLEEIERGRSID